MNMLQPLYGFRDGLEKGRILGCGIEERPVVNYIFLELYVLH